MLLLRRRFAVTVCGLVALFVVRTSAQDLPPQTPPPAPPGAIVRPQTPKPPQLPVLPVDARRLVDQMTASLIEQLQTLQENYLTAQRPDDAAAVRAQIDLLKQVTGIADDPARRTDHVNLVLYRDRVGETFEFLITGSADQPVWGTDVYTDDTPLEGAAVHAGVLRSGQTGRVTVTILAAQKQYAGSRRHGIESMSIGASGGSYRIGTGPSAMTRPTSLQGLRGHSGDVIMLPVVGSASGTVWGSDIYTDDSSLAVAAVHAGVLQPGEFGFVRVMLLDGQSSYAAVARNGITSQPYAEWDGSFRIAEAPRPWAVRLPDDIPDGSGMVSLPQLRSHAGVSFSVRVVGSAGPVKGSGVYTDDSSIAAAAVHAGVLKLGEKGYVRVTVLPGQQTYNGSEQNGVKSADAGAWGGSFQVDKGS